MVNASLNWASIVGIVLAVCGAGLYFMRSFKPALARDYDVFFAAIGLLCGGILFFQGWRLDPILQFGQFLLAGTTVFFAYESVRLRGVATDQARRSSFFDDDPPTTRTQDPRGRIGGDWEDQYENFDRFNDGNTSRRRRFSDQQRFRPEEDSEEDFYRPRRTSRAAIPEEAASRRAIREGESWSEETEKARRMARFGSKNDESAKNQNFGERRLRRQEQRQGTRPSRNQGQSIRQNREDYEQTPRKRDFSGTGIPKGTPIKRNIEDASFSSSDSLTRGDSRTQGSRPSRPRQTGSSSPRSQSTRKPPNKKQIPRDNNSRFDD